MAGIKEGRHIKALHQHMLLHDNMRIIGDIWEAIDSQRVAADVPVHLWKRSYTGVHAAMQHVGLTLVTTQDEFDKLEIPVQSKTWKNYSTRKVIVSRDGVVSQPVRIDHLLSGRCSLLTAEEQDHINETMGKMKSAALPKGIATLNHAETRAVDELDDLLGTQQHIMREHLYEHRLADIAYSQIGAPRDSQIWLGDQGKHAVVDPRGKCNFHASGTAITIAGMLRYLKAGLSLTCIGKTAEGKIDVVWFFHGDADIVDLSTFDQTYIFQPMLHLKIASSHKFTVAHNAQHYRFDVGKSADECDRLMQRKLIAVQSGVKHTLTYLNEHDSQIPSESHRLEHKAFAITRTACSTVGVNVEHLQSDAYGPVDFHVGGAPRIQDKAVTYQADMRSSGRHPYNPDDIDILQITDVNTKTVYALPMRVIRDNKVVSFFSEEALMRHVLTCGTIWKEAHKEYMYDLNNTTGVKAYIAACLAANKVPQLTDRSWYSNMLTANAKKFGSKKEMKKRNAASKA